MTVPAAPAAAVPDVVPPPAEGNGRTVVRRRRTLRILLFTAGLGVLGVLAALVGWGPIAANLARIDGYFFVLLASATLFVQVGNRLLSWVSDRRSTRSMAR